MTNRKKSYGEEHKLSIVDKLGGYLSLIKIKAIINQIKKPIFCLDIGCGYDARLLFSLIPYIESGTGIDVSISDRLKKIENLNFIEESVESALKKTVPNAFNLILMNSVLEHFDNPLAALKDSYQLLKEDGVLIINVPTWLGKYFLEISAFRFGLSPKEEMDDHKMYYDKKDLWPLLVKAGFKPSKIRMEYHKFGLNLFSCVLK